jgi:hypothetical protein
MEHHPLAVFLLWIGELIFTCLVSVHLHFDMNDFRVWTLWGMAMLTGIMQLFIHRKPLKKNFIEWWTETFKRK